MNKTQIKRTILKSNLAFKEIGTSAFRAVRELDGDEYAQYFIDFSNSLPDEEELYDYQASLLGDAYFGNANLQWSSYLFFVLDANVLETTHASDIARVELDRDFARKFVVTQERLSEYLRFENAPKSTGGGPADNIEQVWESILAPHGLDKAVFTEIDLSRKSRLELVVEGASTTSKASRRTSRAGKAPTVDTFDQFVRTVKSKKFRPKTDGETFEFADVTLISGPNSSGKTSVLEAIEYFYCGANARDLHSGRAGTRIDVSFSDGSSDKTKAADPRQIFKDRDLEWYGRLDRQSSHLQESFARCNFLNADAAAALELRAGAEKDAQSALSNLVVGPSASRRWEYICELNYSSQREATRTSAEVERLERDLEILKGDLSELESARKRSSAASQAAKSALSKLGWKLELDPDDELGDLESLESDIEELVSLLALPSELKSFPKPISLQSIATHLDALRNAAAKFQRESEAHDASESQLESLVGDSEALDHFRSLVSRAKEYEAADFSDAVDALRKQRDRLAGLERLASVDGGSSDQLSEVLSLSFADALTKSKKLARNASSTLQIARRDRDAALQSASELEALTGSLVAAAEGIRGHRHANGTREGCPLCGTEFSSVELSKRIAKAGAAAGSSAASAAEQRVVEADQAVSRSEAFVRLVAHLDSLAEGSDWQSVEEALAAVSAAKVEVSQARIDAEKRLRAVERLNQEGFDEEELNELSIELREFSVSKLDVALGALVKSSEKRLRTEDSKLEKLVAAERKRLKLSHDAMRDAVAAKSGSLLAIQDAAEDLQDRISAANDYLDASESLLDRQLPRNKAISELIRTLRSCSNLLGKLRDCLDHEERLSASVGNQTESRRDELKQKRKEREIWQLASEKYGEIVTNHTLESATANDLDSNREMIEWIFRRIHSPVEFQGLADDGLLSLKRDDAENSTAGLSQISTGQRSAFALAVFLAFNRLSKKAPPIILIDDPVAHTDDLNTLAFLDYLRDLVLSGQRQVVFATASTKLAGLFRRKFEFLESGGKFKEINLEQ